MAYFQGNPGQNVQDWGGGADTSIPSPRTKDGEPRPHGPAGNQFPPAVRRALRPQRAGPPARNQVSGERRTRDAGRWSRPLLYRTRVPSYVDRSSSSRYAEERPAVSGEHDHRQRAKHGVDAMRNRDWSVAA
jgi:hypothetical protein